MKCRREEDSSDESEQGEMDEDEEEEIPLDMEVQYLKPEICWILFIEELLHYQQNAIQ